MTDFFPQISGDMPYECTNIAVILSLFVLKICCKGTETT